MLCFKDDVFCNYETRHEMEITAQAGTSCCSNFVDKETRKTVVLYERYIWLGSPVDAPMCSMVDPEMFSAMKFFLLIQNYIGSRNKFSLVAQGNFFKLHKCKMAADRYVNICYNRTVWLIEEPLPFSRNSVKGFFKIYKSQSHVSLPMQSLLN